MNYQDPDLDLIIQEQSIDPESASNLPEAHANSTEAKTEVVAGWTTHFIEHMRSRDMG